jgi:hypothetical protein
MLGFPTHFLAPFIRGSQCGAVGEYVYVRVPSPFLSLIVPDSECVDPIFCAARNNISAICVHSARIVSPSVMLVVIVKTKRVAISKPPDLVDHQPAFV